MEKQSTSRLLKLLAAVFAMFLLMMGGLVLAACGDDEEEAHTHAYTKDNSKSLAATCGAIGYDVYTCDDCGFTYGQMTAAKGTHDWTDGHYCKNCGMSEYTAAADLAKINAFVEGYKQVDLSGIESKLNALSGLATAEKLEAVLDALDDLATSDALDDILEELDEIAGNTAILDAVNSIKTALDELEAPATPADLAKIEKLVQGIDTKLAALNNLATKDDVAKLTEIADKLAKLDTLDGINSNVGSIRTTVDGLAADIVNALETKLSGLATKGEYTGRFDSIDEFLKTLATAKDLEALATKGEYEEQFDAITNALKQLKTLDEKLSALSESMEEVPGKIDDLAGTVANIETAVTGIKAETAKIKELLTSADFDKAVEGINENIAGVQTTVNEILAYLQDEENCHLVHRWENSISVKETCTSIGLEIEQCLDCGSTRVVKSTAALGHKFNKRDRELDREATCISRASYAWVCENEGCKEVFHDYYGEYAPNNHDFQRTGKILKEATDLVEGEEETKCTRCGKIGPNAPIEKKNHTHVWIESIENVEPNCETTGIYYEVCETCDAVRSVADHDENCGEDYADCHNGADHDFNDVTDEKQMTPDQDKITLDAKGHTIDEESSRIRYEVDESKLNKTAANPKDTNTLEWNGAVCEVCEKELLLDKDGKYVAVLEVAKADLDAKGSKSEYATHFKTSWHPWFRDTDFSIDPTCTEPGISWYVCMDSNCQLLTGQLHPIEKDEANRIVKEKVGEPDEVTGRWIKIEEAPRGHLFGEASLVKITSRDCMTAATYNVICQRCTDHVVEITVTGTWNKWDPEGKNAFPGIEDETYLKAWTVTANPNDKFVTYDEESEKEVAFDLQSLKSILVPLGHNWVKGDVVGGDTCGSTQTYTWTCECTVCDGGCGCKPVDILVEEVDHLGKVTYTFSTYELNDWRYCAVENGAWKYTYEIIYCTSCDKLVSIEKVEETDQFRFRHFPFDRDMLEALTDELNLTELMSKLELDKVVEIEEEADVAVVEELEKVWRSIDSWYNGKASTYFSNDLKPYLALHAAEAMSEDGGYVVVCFDCFETLYEFEGFGYGNISDEKIEEVFAETGILYGDLTIDSKTILNEKITLIDGNGFTLTGASDYQDLILNHTMTVQNITFEQGDSKGWMTVVLNGDENVTITFKNVVFAADSMFYAASDGGFKGSVVFENCIFEGGCYNQIQLACKSVSIKDCTIYATGDVKQTVHIIAPTEWTFENNTLINASEQDTAIAVKFIGNHSAEKVRALLENNTLEGGAQIALNDSDSVEKLNGLFLSEKLSNLEDNANIELEDGVYDLPRSKASNAEGQSGWYFAIEADGVTIKGGEGVILKSTEESENGAWASQNFITIFGDGVTLEGFTIICKQDANKAIEVLGNNSTIKDVRIEVEGDSKFGGSIAYSGNKVTEATLEDVTVNYGWITTNYVTSGSFTLNIKGNVTVNFAGTISGDYDVEEDVSSYGYNPINVGESVTVEITEGATLTINVSSKYSQEKRDALMGKISNATINVVGAED